jgi:hypothetical protein
MNNGFNLNHLGPGPITQRPIIWEKWIMARFLTLGMVALAIAFCGFSLATADMPNATMNASAAAVNGIDSPNTAAYGDTYTVWYQRPGYRWTGISGLSYYHACQVRDDLLSKGVNAYIERE